MGGSGAGSERVWDGAQRCATRGGDLEGSAAHTVDCRGGCAPYRWLQGTCRYMALDTISLSAEGACTWLCRCCCSVQLPERADHHCRCVVQGSKGFGCTWAGERASGRVAERDILADFDGPPVDDALRREPGMAEALKDAESWRKLQVGATVELNFDNGESAVGTVTGHDEIDGSWEVTAEETGTVWPLTPAVHTYRVLDGEAESSEEEGGDSYMWTEDEDRRLASLMAEKQSHVSWETLCECLANNQSTRQVQQRWRSIEGEYHPSSQDRREAHKLIAALASKRIQALLSPPSTGADGPGSADRTDLKLGASKRGRKSDQSRPAPKLFVRESERDAYQDWADETKSSRNSRQARLVKEFRTLLDKAKETEERQASPRAAQSSTGSEDDEDSSRTASDIDYEDGPGGTLIEHTFRDSLELTGTDFAQFGPWVGRRIILERDQDDQKPRGPGAVIGWSAGSKVSDSKWRAKTDGGKMTDLTQSELAEAMSAAEKTGIISFGERSGMQKTEDLEDVCDELEELLECALDRMGGNQVVWAKAPGFPWWPAELLTPQEARSMCLLAPRLLEEWEDDQFLVRYFGSKERVGWVLATKCLGFDEVNNVTCMPSKSSKFRLAVLESMKQAAKRIEELNPRAVAEASTRPLRSAAEDEGTGGRRRRSSQKPARFREVEKSPAKKPKLDKQARKEPKSLPKVAIVPASTKSKKESAPPAREPDRGQTRLTPLEAHIARQTLVEIITDVWVEYSVEEKRDIVEQVNDAFSEANQEAIYTVPKLNKYIQNLRYKAQVNGEPRGGGDGGSQTKRSATEETSPESAQAPGSKRRMPAGLSTGVPDASWDHNEQEPVKDEASLTAFLAAAAGTQAASHHPTNPNFLPVPAPSSHPQGWLQCAFTQPGPLNMEFDERMLVIRVDQGGQAWQQGVRVGMRLAEFQGVQLASLSFDAIMAHIRSTPRPWSLMFAPPDPIISMPPHQPPWSPTKKETPYTNRPGLVELCKSFFMAYGRRTGPIHPKEAIDSLKVRPRHMYDLLSILESAGVVAALPAVSGGRKAVVHAGHKGMSNVLANLCAATEPVSPLSERDGRTWRFLSTGLQHAAAAILHILLRNGGGPLLSSTVTFLMFEMISAERKDETSGLRDSSAAALEADAGLTFDVLGIGYFTQTFAENGLTPVTLLNMLDNPTNGRAAVVEFLNSRLGLSTPDSEWVCDQINERRPGIALIEQAARAATSGKATQGQATASGTEPRTEPQDSKPNDHKTAVELDRLHKQLREVFDLLSCECVGVCIHRMLPNGKNIHLACSDPAIIEAGRRLNSRCGFSETVLQLNTQAFPIITPPAAGPQPTAGASAVASLLISCSPDAADTASSVRKSSTDETSPQRLGQVGEMIYYSGQIVQCPRCSLRFRSPQPCHSLVCPDCVLPIEEDNVAAFIRANAQLLPNRDAPGAIKSEQAASGMNAAVPSGQPGQGAAQVPSKSSSQQLAEQQQQMQQQLAAQTQLQAQQQLHVQQLTHQQLQQQLAAQTT